MTTHTDVIDHPCRRLVVGLPLPYEEAREQYETLVPEVDLARFLRTTSWQEVLEEAAVNAPRTATTRRHDTVDQSRVAVVIS